MRDFRIMKKIIKAIAACGLALAVVSGPAAAAGAKVENAEEHDFSFEGPFGTFDRAQLRRGWQVYKEVCAACHSLKYIRFRNLAEPGGPEFDEKTAKAIAAEYTVKDGPNEEGEMFDRPARLSDAIPSPFPNEQAAKAANNGAYPPDLSLITKAREGWWYPWYSSPFIKLIRGNGGPEYVRSLLMGYKPAPHGEEKEGLHYNPYFKGHWIAMPPPLSDEGVEYADGTRATIEQQATDVAAFLAWAAMPKMEERKRIGLMVLLYMGVFALLMLLVKTVIWRKVH